MSLFRLRLWSLDCQFFVFAPACKHPLLKCVLVFLFLDVSSHVDLLQIAVVLGADLVTFVAQLCHLANLVPPLWPSGGAWDDPGAPGSTKTETILSRLHFSRLCVHLRTAF